MERRSLFYWSREYSVSLGRGHFYQELPRVITINIVGFDFLPEQHYHTCFHLWEDKDRNCMLTDVLEIHFVNMVKFRKLTSKDWRNNPEHRWFTYLNKDTDDTIIKEIIDMDSAIKQTEERLVFLTSDKELLREYYRREMAEMDLLSFQRYSIEQGLQQGMQQGIQHGIQQGIQEGRKEGEIKAKYEFISTLANNGLTEDEIARWTNTPKNEVNTILKNKPDLL